MRMARAFIAAGLLAVALVAAVAIPALLAHASFGFTDWPTSAAAPPHDNAVAIDRPVVAAVKVRPVRRAATEQQRSSSQAQAYVVAKATPVPSTRAVRHPLPSVTTGQSHAQTRSAADQVDPAPAASTAAPAAPAPAVSHPVPAPQVAAASASPAPAPPVTEARPDLPDALSVVPHLHSGHGRGADESGRARNRGLHRGWSRHGQGRGTN
jgi:hypothetical protein